MTTETVSEAERLRRVPGVYFGDEPAGRVAKVAGTGIDVWQIISGFKSVAESRERLARGFHWLEPWQLDAALDYYAAFPAEIDHRLAEEDLITPEWVAENFPLRPGQAWSRPRLR